MAGPHAAEEPSSREKFFLPNNKKSGYEFHPYEMIDGHPLSLKLCELIENLAPQLPLTTANIDMHDMIPPPAHGITHFPSLSPTDEYSYRLSPPIRAASPSNFGTFAQTSATLDAKYEDDVLSDDFISTLDPDEIARNYQYWESRN